MEFSPRISFSRDFVEADHAEAEAATRSAEDAGKRLYSSDFEFAMAACLDHPHPQGCAPRHAMLPADELISHGMLLPFDHSRTSSSTALLPHLHASSSSSSPSLSVSASASASVSASVSASASASHAPSLTASKSYPPSGREVSLPLSPKAPKRSAKWRELLGLKARPDNREKENVSSGKEAANRSSSSSSSCRIMRMFSRSRSVGSGEIAPLSTLARSSTLSSVPQSSPRSVLQEQIFRPDFSHQEDGDSWTDREGYNGSAARLWIRAGGKHAEQAHTSKIKAECSSPRRNSPQGRIVVEKYNSNNNKHAKMAGWGEHNSNSNSIPKYSKMVGWGERNNNNNNSNNSNKHAKMVGWGEHWRLANNNIAYSNVRVAPVLLNVPSCISPSLRGAKVSKTKLMNLRHLLPPKKAEHSKPL